jgi:hypothetical protein
MHRNTRPAGSALLVAMKARPHLRRTKPLSLICDKLFFESNQPLDRATGCPARFLTMLLSPASDGFCAAKRTPATQSLAAAGLGAASD